MFELLIKISHIILPVFVFLTMFNVGLSQKLANLIEYIKDWKFGISILVANFILSPLLMWCILYYYPLDPYLATGLTIFSVCAGAPFLIKLTQQAEHDLALGASAMITLVFATVIIAPLLLPILIPQIAINGAAIAATLLKQLIVPVIIGFLLVKVLPNISNVIQPWVSKFGNWTLFLVIITTLLGYLPKMKQISGQGAIIIGVVFVLGAFGIGYVLGGFSRKDHLQDISALGTAQKNTAASMIIATQNFDDHPEVLIIITISNISGIMMLLAIARFLSKDNKIKLS